MQYKFIEYGWNKKIVNESACKFTHPEKPLIVLAYNDSSILQEIPLVNMLLDGGQKWEFAVINKTQDEPLIRKEFYSQHEAFEEVQDYLESHSHWNEE